ncbi:hypothetical protein DICVIV_00491 [Dictyocaulus viviparus]|uniref:Zn-finger in Ran binding protein n=1 Tax=Dictyocaulus viviparus TaxID=29172 RepID=A0A0D8Y956_DICVI|nr:hypothetical protein DICVIV_00491 [Dictyocaulus viviparus]
MSSEKRSWLSSVSRVFSSGQKSSATEAQNSIDAHRSPDVCDFNTTHRSVSIVNGTYSYSAPSRNVRYLSPSILETGSSQPGVSEPKTSERFSIASNTSRKRILTQDEHVDDLVDPFFSRDFPKRSRREQLASSMMEEMSPRLLSGHFDSSRMSRTMGDNSSCVELHSQISNRSLVERIGSSRSNASSLSSKTKAILNHLEKISTPAREARKMPVMRGSILSSERWVAMNSGTAAPPLLRTSATVPSRIQLLSTSIASQRRPYWRDITRKVQSKEQNDSNMENNDKIGNNSQVDPLFDMDNITTQAMDSKMSAMLSQKNADEALAPSNCVQSEKGNNHNTSVINVFNASELIDGELDSVAKDNHNDAYTFAPPSETVLSAETVDDMVFTFDAPVERQLGVFVDEEDDYCSNERSENRNFSEGSSSGSDSDEEHNSVSDAEEISTVPTDQKISRPPTAADSETSAAISSTVTPVSSKDASPQTKTEASWNCPNCSVTNTDASVCTSCGHKYVDVAVPIKPASKLSTCVNLSTNAEIETGEAIESPPHSCSDNTEKKPVNSFSLPSSKVQHISDANHVVELNSKSNVTEPDRKAWECPDCMAIDSKCVCCGHVMYKSADEAQSNTSVFGERAFNAVKSAPKYSFGFGGSSCTSSSSGATTFGFGSSNDSATKSSRLSERPGIVFGDSKATTSADYMKEANPQLSSSGSQNTGVDSKLQAPSLSLSSGAPIFGLDPKPPLFGSSSAFLFKTSSTESPLCTLSNSEPTKALTTSNEGSSRTLTSFSFGTAPNMNSTGQPGIFNKQKEENSTSMASPFGYNLFSGELSGNKSNANTGVTVSNTDSIQNMPSTSTGIFGAVGAGKSVFPTFGVPSESSKPFMKTTSSSINMKPSPFEGNVSTSSEILKPTFGVPAAPVTKTLFGTSTTTIPNSNSNGALNFNFGSTNAFGGFTSAAPSTAATSTTSTLSSVPMFGTSINTTDAPKPFQFNTLIPEPTFQFGQAPLSGTTPFQFGSSQLTAPVVPSLQAQGVSAPTVPSSNFSFTSSGSRKMVAARRRLPQRK